MATELPTYPPSSSEEDETSSEESETSSEESETSSEEEKNEPVRPQLPEKKSIATQPQATATITKPQATTVTITKPQATTITKPQVATITKPQSKASSSKSKIGFDSESDSEDATAKEVVNPIVKPPVSSNPIDETQKMQPSTTPVRYVVKRLSKKNQVVSEPKRIKNASRDDETRTSENVRKNAEQEPKKLFQGRWSENDVIALLKGMIFFMDKMGLDPCKQINQFHDFVKEFIQSDVGKDQLLSKIQRMKKNYLSVVTNISRNGDDPSLSKSHNKEVFNLSKKIWGIEGENGRTAKSNKKDEKNQKKGSTVNHNISSTLAFIETIRFDKHLRLSGLCQDNLMKGLELLEPSQRAALDSEWFYLQDAEMDIFIKRMDLMRNQTAMIKKALREDFINSNKYLVSIWFPCSEVDFCYFVSWANSVR
ncbi:putative transcription factor [Senna tora]|uniref:Putative transcription factor n=1 Tax=Senna tora TaxID=362788 RepID=A0A834SNP3_9FABA|nr:putative transcription factor [Senna tora]